MEFRSDLGEREGGKRRSKPLRSPAGKRRIEKEVKHRQDDEEAIREIVKERR